LSRERNIDKWNKILFKKEDCQFFVRGTCSLKSGLYNPKSSCGWWDYCNGLCERFSPRD